MQIIAPYQAIYVVKPIQQDINLYWFIPKQTQTTVFTHTINHKAMLKTHPKSKITHTILVLSSFR
jgi:hypothetical protein